MNDNFEKIWDPDTESGKLRQELYSKINHKRWSHAKNLGKNEKPPQGWTLCNIGPENAFIELSYDVISKIKITKIEEEALKGEETFTLDVTNEKEFWINVCSLITQENFDHIFNNLKLYYDLLIRGAILYCGLRDKYPPLIIESLIPLMNKKLKRFLKDIHYEADKQLGDGFNSLINVASQLEKDFLAIESKIEVYLKTCFENILKSLLPPEKESIKEPKDAVAGFQKWKMEEAGIIYQSETPMAIQKKDFKDKLLLRLTDRQKKIFKGIIEEKTQKDIADNIGFTDRTVRLEKDKILEIAKKLFNE